MGSFYAVNVETAALVETGHPHASLMEDTNCLRFL
jgi:hypothetical protein